MKTMPTATGMELFGTAAEIKQAVPSMDQQAFDQAHSRLLALAAAGDGGPVSVRFRSFEGPLLVTHDHLLEWGYDSQSWTAIDGDAPQILFARDSGR